MNKKDKSKLYDKMYHAGEILFIHHNPCKFVSGVCSEKLECCKGCKYLKKTGCTVKALDCKLWICSENKDILLKKRLYFLKRVQYRYLPIGERKSKKDLLGGILCLRL